MTKAQLLAAVKKVDRLIAPLKIDTLRLTDDETLRVERARMILRDVQGLPHR